MLWVFIVFWVSNADYKSAPIWCVIANHAQHDKTMKICCAGFVILHGLGADLQSAKYVANYKLGAAWLILFRYMPD